MKRLRQVLAVVCVVNLVCSPSIVGQSKPTKEQKKALEARAKTIVAEAKQLETQKKYLEAREKFVDAQAVAVTKDGTNGVNKMNEAIRKEVEKLIKASDTAFKAGDNDKAMKALQDAQALKPQEAAIFFNMAIIELKLGRTEQALEHFDTAIIYTSDNDEKQKIHEMRTALGTQKTMTALVGPTKEKIEELNQLIEDSANHDKVCAMLGELRPSLNENPTLLLNLAACKEEEGKTEEAQELFAAYTKAAPKAIDTKDAKDGYARVSALMGLDGEVGTKVRAEYADAAKRLRGGEFTRALAAYARAEELSPNFPETQWRLANLHQALGNTGESTKRFERYLTLEKDPERQAIAKADLEAMTLRQTRYDERTNEGQRLFDTLVDKTFIQSETLDLSVAQREMNKLSSTLQEAVTLVPLGGKSNAMLGETYLLGNNYEAAKRSFMAVRDKGGPIAFLTEYTMKDGPEQRGLAKVEITDSAVTLLPMSLWDKKAKQFVPTADAAKILEGFSGLTPTQGVKSAVRLEYARVKKVETKASLVQITLDKGELFLSPKYLVSMVPPNGPVARRHANTYTKLFRDFTPVTDVELGPERMTGGEKFGVAMSIAAAAMGSYGALAGSAMSAAQRVQVIMSAIQSATRQLQLAVIQQRELLQGSQFKLIPTDAPEPKFRAELLQ